MMLPLPTRGLDVSVNQHNVDLDVLCDWIEGSVLLASEELYHSDIADRLIEEERYRDQEFALTIVHGAWEELERRSRLCGSSYGITVTDQWLKPRGARWEERTSYVLCLLLSLAAKYDWWHKEFGPDYAE